MQNEPADDYEGEEEGEYHFADEEVNYDADDSLPEAGATPASSSTSATVSDNAFTRLSRTKRMAISFTVFVILIFVVYKVMSPSSDNNVSPDAAFMPPPKTAVTTANPSVAEAPVVATVPAAPPAPEPEPKAVAENEATSPVVTPPMNDNAPLQKPAMPMMPVKSATPATYPGQQPYDAERYHEQYGATPPVAQDASPYEVPGSEKAASDIAKIQADNQQRVSELQTQYTQTMNNYQTENRQLQDEVQSLNSKVATLEGRLSDMLDTLKKEQAKSAEAANMKKTAKKPKAPVIKYSVQAIIPGRAWLKSESGETITVAEGDTIDGVGKVTKIDPYDGVVEVNTGEQTISLTYGMGN